MIAILDSLRNASMSRNRMHEVWIVFGLQEEFWDFDALWSWAEKICT